MTTAEAIARLNRPSTKGLPLVLARVTAVDADAASLDCQPLNGDCEIYEVRFSAVLSPDEGFLLTPKVGSTVVVEMLNDATGYVALWSALDRASLQVGTSKVVVTPEGLVLARGSEDLYGILSDLLTAITQLTVPTNVGPSLTPVNTPAFNLIKQRLSNLFTDAP